MLLSMLLSTIGPEHTDQKCLPTVPLSIQQRLSHLQRDTKFKSHWQVKAQLVNHHTDTGYSNLDMPATSASTLPAVPTAGHLPNLPPHLNTIPEAKIEMPQFQSHNV